MKSRVIILLVFLIAAASVFAQTRKDIAIFIAPVRAAADQAAFFQENFTIETEGAGYAVTPSEKDADYTMKLEVKPNMILYDDGTEEQAPPDEKQYMLQITLVANESKDEIVTFSFPFTDLNEMYDFNLYLVYEAMANVPITKLFSVSEDTRWRNMWVYLRASFDYPVTFYQLLEPSSLWGSYPGGNGEKIYQHLDHKITPYPAATIGLELQYLNWMSSELSFNMSFSDPMNNSFIPAIQIEQKFPIKPQKYFMIEPYAAVSFPMNTSSANLQFPRVGLGGGVQVNVKGGSTSAFFVDVNYIHFLGNVVMKNNSDLYPNPSEIKYSRFVLGLGIGYKVGFFDRPNNLIENEKE